MNFIKKKCPYCEKVNDIPYKRRNRPGYCNLKCAYAARVVWPFVTRKCIQCGGKFRSNRLQKYCSPRCSASGYRGFKHSQVTRLKMTEAWTKERRAAQTIKRIHRTCVQCQKKFEVKKFGKGSEKTICSKNCHRARMRTSNPMKRIELRLRASALAKARTTEARRKIGDGVSRAWRSGKFEGVRTGRCKWYKFTDRSGVSHNLQGTWELAFARWMDERRMKFKSHKTWIRYFGSNGIKRYWYPDFYVESWNAWVDVKADYFYDPKKFIQIRKHNKALKVIILLKADLKRLGVLR